jgi:Ser/Thr protein kinase RdoA (MazF antagonist)
VASIHQAADACPVSLRRPHLDIDYLVRDSIERLRPHLSHRPRDLAFLTSISGELGQAVASLLPSSPPEFGICHGDLTFGNVRRDDSGRFTLIDFDFSGYGWRSYDICVFVWSRGDQFSPGARRNRANQWRAFLEGYRTVRQLSEAELQAVKMFVPLRHIWGLGMHGSPWPHLIAPATSEENLEVHLEFLRSWLKVYKLP